MVTFNQYRTRSGVGAISSLDCMTAEKEVISSLLLWNRDLNRSCSNRSEKCNALPHGPVDYDTRWLDVDNVVDDDDDDDDHGDEDDDEDDDGADFVDFTGHEY